MATNFFKSLPVPAADGVGAPVDVSDTTRFKTFILSGQVPNGAVYAIEASQDGTTWDTLVNLAAPPAGVQTLQAITRFLRVRRRAAGATPTITLGAEIPPAAQVVSDVHVAGNPGIIGAVEIVAGANIALAQAGNRIQVDAQVPPPPPTGSGESSIFFTYSHDETVVSPGTTNEVIVYQHLISYGAMLPPGPLRGFARGRYSLTNGNVTIRIRAGQNPDDISGNEIGNSGPLGATGGGFSSFGIDLIDSNAGGTIFVKVTAQLDTPGEVARIKAMTNKMRGQ